ncbi:amino acid/polyamine/organocation transporter, APC superfamily [Streptomyces zhaozhouensis]|uniref:Amino acid/polyamine/organocation transporter, APC superfamily n=1 Tax=Streptomyces zhaozhouensis TaxID=1300267 RepID=A0A286DVF1_9ACTN|nr:APC family permease [Streptomyces zhaozhouensis]SOD62632.1 amino acid/polyamine/organocation transporter, APC superfamily [Streptomyces zhaozhouensis]
MVSRESEPPDDPTAGGMPSPSAGLPPLDERQVEVLRRVGREWGEAAGDPAAWRRALPVEPNLGGFPAPAEIRPAAFGRHVRVSPLGDAPDLPRPDAIEWEGSEGAGGGRRARLAHLLRRAVLGMPLRSSAIARERLPKRVALPVLSADALSAVAYGPEALLAVLVLAGTAGLVYATPLAALIVVLMVFVALSYRQTIRAYPHGGGSYLVASANLGRTPGLLAAAGLMTDYVLTVSVSVAAGVAAIGPVLPVAERSPVWLGAAVILVLLAGNLRGVRQAGRLFAVPTYAFVLAVLLLVGAGLYQAAGNGFTPEPAAPPHATEAVTLYLVMRAFASGSTAMTGIEAISNAVPIFQPTEWRNARTTLTCMILMLITLFTGIMTLVHLTGVTPNHHETLLSQLAHHVFGSGPWYVFVQLATAAVLLLAANTAYNDFPRVLFLLARDWYAPRSFLRLGDRLAFSHGIILLTAAALLLFVAFGGRTSALIPLYAVGVFLAFTLSQAGMVVHWHRTRDRHRRRSLLLNAAGCALAGVVFVAAVVTKFAAGAWVAILAIGGFLLLTTRIRRHYDRVGEALRLHPGALELPATACSVPAASGPAPEAEGGGRQEDDRGDTDESEREEAPEQIHHLSIVPVAVLDLAGMRALAYAAALRQPVLALHVSPSDEEADRFRDNWHQWGDHLPLEVVVTPYRAIIAPMIHYIEALHRQRPDLTMTVILPEIVPRRRRHRLLHSRVAGRLRRSLRALPKVVVTTVPFHV